MFLFYPSHFQGSASYLVNVSWAENTIIFFKLPFAWGLMQALLLQYFLFVCLFVFCTNCTYSVCKFTRSWCIAGANRAGNKTHCKSGVYMKRLPNGNVKNVMVFSALVNCTKGLSCFRKQIVTQFPEQPSFPKCSFKQHQLSLAQSRANVRMAVDLFSMFVVFFQS